MYLCRGHSSTHNDGAMIFMPNEAWRVWNGVLFPPKSLKHHHSLQIQHSSMLCLGHWDFSGTIQNPGGTSHFSGLQVSPLYLCGIPRSTGSGPILCGSNTFSRVPFRRRQWHPTPVLLPGKSQGQRSLVGCSPWGHEEQDTTSLSFSLFTFMHWRRKWQPTPVFLPGESQGRGSLVGCHLWGRTESDSTEATQQQQYFVGLL